MSFISRSIPSVMQPPSDDGMKCPVCGIEVAFIAPNADLRCRFDDMTETAKAAHDEHCVENHPNEPVWNTFPKRSNVKIVSVEGFIQYTLELAAEISEIDPIWKLSWEAIRSHLYRRLITARSLTDDPNNRLGKSPDFLRDADKQVRLDWKNWIKASTRAFLTSLIDIVWNSNEPEGWVMPSLQRLENLIQICFRLDGGYATCGLIDSKLIPTVPQWPGEMNINEAALLRKKGRKVMDGWRSLGERQKRLKPQESNEIGESLIENDHSDISSVDANKPPLGVGDIIFCKPGIRALLNGATVKPGVVVSVSAAPSVIGVHPYGVFLPSEYIQQRCIVNRENVVQGPSVFNGLDLIHLPDSEPWRMVMEFGLIEGREEHPDSVHPKIAKVLDDFERDTQKAFRDIMTNNQD